MLTNIPNEYLVHIYRIGGTYIHTSGFLSWMWKH